MYCLSSFIIELANEFYSSMSIIGQRAECHFWHIVNIFCGNVKVRAPDSTELNRFVYILCNWEPFFFIQWFAECKLNLITFYINHTTDARIVCNFLDRCKIIYWQSLLDVLERKLAVISELINRPCNQSPRRHWYLKRTRSGNAGHQRAQTLAW